MKIVKPDPIQLKINEAIAKIPPMETWEEYTAQALATWKPESFATPVDALTYVMLGLKSELGEVAGVEKRLMRDGVSESETREALILELGDVCWYLAIARHEALKQGIDSGSALAMFMVKSGFTNLDAAYLAWVVFPGPKLPSVMTPTVHATRSKVFSDSERVFDVRTLFRRNIEKLRARQIRGTIKGKGDKR